MAQRVHGILTAGSVNTETVAKATGGTVGHVIENPIGKLKLSFWGGHHPGWLTGGVYLTFDGQTDPTVAGDDTYCVANDTFGHVIDIPDAQTIEVRMVTNLEGVHYAIEPV